MLERARARDATFDGRFITGVLSTGIYCLPSCRARSPRERNVRFFPTEEAARKAGLRPCKRCRPDLFYRRVDPDLELVRGTAERIRRDPGEVGDVRTLAERTGVGVTRLSSLFRLYYHTTPASYLKHARMDAARRLLAEGRERVLDVALAVGYESLSAFHDAFRRYTGMCPSDYRGLGVAPEFVLELPTGFRTATTLAFWGRDGESPSERVSGDTVIRAVRLSEGAVTLVMRLGAGAAHCRVESDGRVSPGGMRAVHAAAARMLGLAGSPTDFERRVGREPALAPLIRGRRGVRIPQMPEVFEGLTWAILGQQVNLPFAYALRRQLFALAGQRAPGGLLAHPAPEAVARLDLGDLRRRQFSRRKAEVIIDTARLVASGLLPAETLPEEPAPVAEQRLLDVRGLGPWSAGYVMLRACAFADCVPVGDSGLTTALERFFSLPERPDATETRRLMARFAPHRSLATFHLWANLGGPA
jgi:AraC family transcriptional regulator of adaptative response / DNA-3-methyladenine glycosylase II